MYFIIDKASIVAGPFASIDQVVGIKDLNESAIAASSTKGRIVARFVGGDWVVVAPTTRLGYRLRKAMQTRAEAKCLREPPIAADTVNEPPHYNQAGIECIDAIAAATSGKTGIEAVCVANVIKYLWRYELKNGVEDVKKARWYLDRLIKEMGEMITKSQREKLDELIDDFPDAKADYAQGGGSQAGNWVWTSEGALVDFLDSITETPKDA